MSEVLLERETTITWNDEEDEASIWSASPIFHRRMKKLGITPVRTAEREGTSLSCWYTVPKKWVRIRRPIEREYSEEQRTALAERARLRFKGAKESKLLRESAPPPTS